MSTPTSVSFTETMSGAVAFGEQDFITGSRSAEATDLSVRLTITAEDIDRFAQDARHAAIATGSIDCAGLGGRRPVEDGDFNLFVDAGPGRKRMLYRLHFRDGAGHPLTLTGVKIVEDHKGFDVWRDTTTLNTRIYAGHVEEGQDGNEVVASGQIHITAAALAKQMTTFRAKGGSPAKRAAAITRFGVLFGANLVRVYGPMARTKDPTPPTPHPKTAPTWRGARPMRPGDGLHHEIVPFVAGDGLHANLVHIERPKSPTKGPVLLVHGAGVRANLFRSPVKTTFVEHLVQEGYDVWMENWRASIDLAPNPWTLDQAAIHDHPMAVQRVCRETGADSIKAVIHCQGSTSFMMSAVAGLVPQVDTIVANAVTLHPIVPGFSRFKIKRLIPLVAKVTQYIDTQWGLEADTLIEKSLNALVQCTHRECDNPVCKWASFTYGTGFPTLWAHEHLNAETHDWIKDEFAHVPMTFFQQMARCIDAGHLVSVEGDPRLPASFVDQAPQTDARFVLTAGENNRCFLPESQRRTFEFLESHAPGRHAFHLLQGYGHLDPFMGKNAAQDIYPLITKELAR